MSPMFDRIQVIADFLLAVTTMDGLRFQHEWIPFNSSASFTNNTRQTTNRIMMQPRRSSRHPKTAQLIKRGVDLQPEAGQAVTLFRKQKRLEDNLGAEPGIK